jgi:hypothetical protein
MTYRIIIIIYNTLACNYRYLLTNHFDVFYTFIAMIVYPIGQYNIILSPFA